MIDVPRGSLSISKSSFEGCSCSSGPLISLGSISSLSLGDCCFHGAKVHDNAVSYIGCTGLPTFSFELPLCFDLTAAQSVSFGDASPFENLTSHYHIFECHTCGNPATVEFTDSEFFTDNASFTSSQAFTPMESSFTSSSSSTESEEPVSLTTEGAGNAEKGGLGAGAIAGIVVAVLVIIAIVVILVILLLLRRTREQSQGSDQEGEMTEETFDNATTYPAPSIDDGWEDKVTEDNPCFTQTSNNDDFDQVFEEDWD